MLDLDFETAQAIVNDEDERLRSPRTWWQAWEFVHADLPEDEKFLKRFEALLNSPFFLEAIAAAFIVKKIKEKGGET